MSKIFILAISIFAISGCASRKYGEENIETKIDKKGISNNGTIGFDKNELVIQKTTSISDELRITQHVNESLQSDLNYEHYMLNWCYEDVARLTGQEVTELIEVDEIKNEPEYKEVVGTDESGKIVFLRKQNFKETIESERAYEVTLRKLLKTVKSNRTRCERKMSVERIKNGLPGKRFEGKGHFENGAWIQDQPRENSLDDAYEIIKKK